MSTLFAYPRSALFNRPIPKRKFYQQANASRRQQDAFVQHIEQILWQYKLSPDTINIPPGEHIREIQIFKLTLRSANIDTDLLRLIDKAIPYPLLFELVHNQRVRLMAAHKRPSEADANKWVIGKTYFGGDWLPQDASRQSLPLALHLDALYDKLLAPLLPVKAVAQESLLSQMQRAEDIEAQQREVAKLQQRLQREKQFNKRVEVNRQLRSAKQALQALKGTQQSLDFDEHNKTEDSWTS